MASKSEDIVLTDYEYDSDETVINTIDISSENSINVPQVNVNNLSDSSIVSDEEERKLTEECLPDVDITFFESLNLNKPDVVIPGMIQYLCSNHLGEAGTIMKLFMTGSFNKMRFKHNDHRVIKKYNDLLAQFKELEIQNYNLEKENCELKKKLVYWSLLKFTILPVFGLHQTLGLLYKCMV